MNRLVRLCLIPLLVALAVRAAAQPTYPRAKTVDVVDELHGVKIADPYRWMEDLDAPDLKQWIEAQNEITFGYLNEVPQREAIEARLTKLWDYERFGVPQKQGGRYFYSRNDGLQNQSVLYVASSLDEAPRVLLDPNTLSSDGTVALSGYEITKDGKWMAYGLSAAGSDWDEFKVRSVDTGEDLPETLKWIKFSGMSWKKDGSGFYYSRYDEPSGNVLSSLNKWPKVHFHAPRTTQDQDALVYERPDEPDWGFGASVSEDGRYLILSISQGTERKNRLFYRDLETPPRAWLNPPVEEQIHGVMREACELWMQVYALPKEEQGKAKELTAQIDALRAKRAALVKQNHGQWHGFTELLTEFDAQYDFIGNDGPVFYFFTDLNAPRGRVIAIDTAKPQRENWKELIPQTKDTLRGVGLVNNQFIAAYLKDAYTEVRIHDLSGKLVRSVDLPGIGSAGGFGGERTDTETFYSFTSFATPATIYRYDLTTGTSTIWKQPKVDFDPSAYEVKQVFYPAKDGTKIPMFIVHRKGLQLNGANPTYLYAYGG
ncbi:MAG: hypothetical protein AB7Q17_17585, partial [Phycisphaerae bacterium]